MIVKPFRRVHVMSISGKLSECSSCKVLHKYIVGLDWYGVEGPCTKLNGKFMRTYIQV